MHPNEDAPLIARPYDDADDDEKENDEWLDLLRDDFDALTKVNLTLSKSYFFRTKILIFGL